ncbi:choice-of-anchor J domain-containing protein [Nocardioides sp. NPDC127503]|uniref:choice-of-anchor J domain-containing protein n=1 Tax=Nocardioides sp. NPDC127503 TaxID=3154516 RepID=UPI0033248EEB
MRGWKRTRLLTIGAAGALVLGLTLPGAPAGSAPPADDDRGRAAKELKQTGSDYNNGKKVGIDRKRGDLAGKQPPKGPAKVGQSRTWLGLDDAQGSIYLKDYTLRGVGDNIEVWVADDRAFPDGDCRNALGLTEVTDAQVSNFISEFDNTIYPIESEEFSVPPDRDGKQATLPGLIPNLPSSEYKGDGDNIVVLVDNVRDANFYEPATPDGQTYIAGFFYSVFNEYFDRNVMSIDVFDWLHRTGTNPPDDSTDPAYVACNEELNSAPGRLVGASRPLLYEGTFAHEYQHLLEYYEDADEVSWINEGLSDYAQTLVGYVDPSTPPDDPGADSHLACFMGYLDPAFGGSENSLTGWGDQGGPETLCDYGAVYSFMQYLASHYGPDFLSALHREDAGGIEGLQIVLDQFDAGISAQQTIHDWAAMVALDAALDANGGNLNGGDAATFQADSLSAKVNWDNPEAWNENGAPPNGSDYVRLRDGAGAYLSAGEIESLSFDGASALEPKPVEWTVDTTPPDATTADSSCGSPPADGTGAAALYAGCGPNLDRSVVRAVDVPAGGASLTFDALWDAEVGWDFGYVQVSTDGGETWQSLATADTTSEHDPGAIPTVVDNLPGFSGDSGGWRQQSADLSTYGGQSVLVAFRYITDSGVDESGFWVRDIAVGGTALPSDTLAGWQSMSQVNPTPVEGWTVQLVAYGPAGSPAWVHTLALDESFDGTLSGAALDAAIGDTADTVAAIVMFDDPTESVADPARYTLTVDGVTQPGG